MARYFFDFYDGVLTRDTDGSECTGYEEIRREAMQTLPDFARTRVPENNGDTQAYTVSVRNERNITVYTATLTFAGIWLGEEVPPADDTWS